MKLSVRTAVALFELIGLTGLTSSAHAHVAVGTWIGATPEGAPCSLIAGEQYFEDHLHHPLSERVPVEFNGVKFVMAHPAVVDVSKPMAFFNHGVFQSVLPQAGGAQALVIDMEHTEAYEGPTAFHWVNHNWRTDVATRLDCLNIRHQEKN